MSWKCVPERCRPALSNVDRLLFVLLSRLVPTTLNALTVIRPDTVIRWHRAGFRAYWRWKSTPRGGRPRTRHAGCPALGPRSTPGCLVHPLHRFLQVHGVVPQLFHDPLPLLGGALPRPRQQWTLSLSLTTERDCLLPPVYGYFIDVC
jgi:hypothetical protein